MRAGRIALVAALCAAGGLVLWAALSGGPPSLPRGTPGGAPVEPPPSAPFPAPAPGGAAPGPVFSHPSQCRSCHPEVYEEWTLSMHAKATSDPEVRALSDDFKSVECISCHAPLPIHSAPVGGRVFERASRFETGVDCLSCHLLPDGGVAASRDVPSAPCRPRKVDTLADPVTCRGCHNQHDLVDEWEDLFHAPDPARGAVLQAGRPETCVDCHMGPAARGPAAGGAERKGLDHVFRGGYYEEVLRKAVTLAARIEGGGLVAEVANTGTGHRAPADSRHRSFNLWVTAATESGIKVHDRTEIWEGRMYYRNQFRDNSNLRPGETAVARFALPRGVKGKVLVELVFCMNPLKKERREARRVHAVEMEFDTR